MNAIVEYTYANGGLLEKPNTYFYSTYLGEDFIFAWADSRAACMAECLVLDAKEGQPVKNEHEVDISPTGRYLKKLLALFTTIDIAVDDRKNLDAILRNFEAKKRIYQDYNIGFTSKDRTDYRELGLYVLFAELMVAAYHKWQELQYVNALIKCIDILCAYHTQLQNPERLRMRTLIVAEREYFEQLTQRLGLNKS